MALSEEATTPTAAPEPGAAPVSAAGLTPAQMALRSLDDQQRAAISALIGRKSKKEAAAAAGVSRSTLLRWCAADPVFRRTLDLCRIEQCDQAYDALAALVPAATTVLADAIGKGDARLALRLLERIGVARVRTVKEEPPLPEREQPWYVELVEVGQDHAMINRNLQSCCHLSKEEADEVLASRLPRRVAGPLTKIDADQICDYLSIRGTVAPPQWESFLNRSSEKSKK